MERVAGGGSTHFSHPRPQQRSHKELEPFQLRLDNYQLEVRRRVHGPGHFLNDLYLIWAVSQCLRSLLPYI